MQDWATFFFTGSNVLPAFMVLNNEDAFGLAIIVFFGLLLTACIFALRDEDCPARQATTQDRERHVRNRRRDPE